MKPSTFRICLLAAVALVGCGGGAAPDVVSRLGTKVYFEGLKTDFSQETVDAMESELTQGLIAQGWDAKQTPEWLSGAEIHLTAKNFPCEGLPGKTCAGQDYGNYLLISLQPEGGAWGSAYRHELAHRMQGRRGEADPTYAFSYDLDHKDTAVWPVVYASH